jgi:hypothetical protein
MPGSKEMNISPSEQALSRSKSESGAVVAPETLSHLPEGQLLPINPTAMAELVDKLALLIPQLTPQEKGAVDSLYNRALKSWSNTKIGIQDVLDSVRTFAQHNLKKENRARFIANGLLLFMLMLAACAPLANANGDTELPSPASNVENPIDNGGDTGEQAVATAEGIPPLSELDVDYGRYSDNEAAAVTALTPRWQEIANLILSQNLALPSNILIVDISADNVLIEALETGRGDDYEPAGTTFTMSYVQGHEGEILTVTLEGANSVAGITAVELALGANGLPVALDDAGSVVRYVDQQTGQWRAGSVPLAPEIVEGVAQTTATPETPAIDEHDIEPIHIQEVSGEFMGVQIKTNIITDYSLSVSNPAIMEVTLADSVALEYVARNVFTAWWYHGNIEHTDKPTETDFQEFMQKWAAAQSGEGSWEDVEFTIYANDLNDGNGYEQTEHTFWPMFDGDVPEEINSINQINIVAVRSSRVDNITIRSERFDKGFGTNIDNTVLNFYIGLTYGGGGDSRETRVVASQFVSLPWWIQNNSGKPMTSTVDTSREFSSQVQNKILNGLHVSPPPG